MSVDRHTELIHAEIDGELDAQQRAELSRYLLADPDVRALRDDLRRLCAALDETPQSEPPPDLQNSILAALPVTVTARAGRRPSPLHWRHAAAAACLVVVGAVVFFSLRGQAPPSTDVAGTMAASGAVVTLDTVDVRERSLSGRVSLIRDSAQLGVRFELTAPNPVDAVIASDGHTLRVTDVGRASGPGGTGITVTLPGIGPSAQPVSLTFLIDGRQVGSAVLRAPESR
jgi:anti-sigma factor RsiW